MISLLKKTDKYIVNKFQFQFQFQFQLQFELELSFDMCDVRTSHEGSSDRIRI